MHVCYRLVPCFSVLQNVLRRQALQQTLGTSPGQEVVKGWVVKVGAMQLVGAFLFYSKKYKMDVHCGWYYIATAVDSVIHIFSYIVE